MAPGNSLRAFDLALEAGADGVELDVRRTVDGHWVAYHDKTFMEGGRRQKIMRMNRERLGADVASVAEVVDWIQRHPQVVVDVEVKDVGHEDELVEPFRPVSDRIFFTSYIPDVVWTLKQADPAFVTGLLAAHPGPFNLEVARLARCHLIVWRDEFVDEPLARRSLDRGLKPVVWDVTSRRRVRTLADWGVVAVVTDRVPRRDADGRKA
jgi:glycerophosphoryl diester phosphodiesterase